VRRLEGLEAHSVPGAAPLQPAFAPAQKKNDLAAPQRPAPAAAAPAAPATAEAAPQGPAPRGDAEAWKKLLGQVSSRKPALYNILLSVKLVFSGGDTIRLLSAAKFETSMIEAARAELEEMLERHAGRKITLVPETQAAAPEARDQDGGSGMPAPEDEAVMVEPSEAEEALEAQPAHKPHEPRQVSADGEPELKHLNKVFHGRITRINKVK
jgi:hypothetical protein